MEGIKQAVRGILKIFYLLFTQTPGTLIGLIILIFLYYFLKVQIRLAIQESRKKSTTPPIDSPLIQEYTPWWRQPEWKVIFTLVEFVLVVALSVALLKVMGFKIPKEIMQ